MFNRRARRIPGALHASGEGLAVLGLDDEVQVVSQQSEVDDAEELDLVCAQDAILDDATESTLSQVRQVPCELEADVHELEAVWGLSSTNVVTVGAKGAILRFDGASWNTEKSGTTARLSSVWGGSPTNIYAASGDGNTAVLRHDGTSWKSLTKGSLDDPVAIWGTSPTNIYLGWRPRHYNGATVKDLSTPKIIGKVRGIWGSGPSDVFMVGDKGGILHFDGVAWKAHSSGVSKDLYSIWGSSATNVFAVGGGRPAVRRQGVDGSQDR